MKPYIHKLSMPVASMGRVYRWRLVCPKCSSKTVFESWQQAVDYVTNY